MADIENNDKNQEVNPKTAKQVALWLQRGRMKLARTEAAAEKPKADARTAQTDEATTEIPAAAAIPQRPAFTPPTKGKVAAFLWMPQINLSLQAFSFPLALLVQTFAQILVGVGLLPAEHPARNYSGAKAYGITQLLEEARQGLPPLRTLWGNGTRILATRQYAIFASTIGVLVTGGLALFSMFTGIFFGFAKAFAQAPYNPNISLNFTDNGKLGLGFINAIFDPTGANLISSGIGGMLRFYSSSMLVFAGLIVLWIIISAVAETARTGIPFGKQFNHVWAPIRLVVALGLLIPLGSGLNSGQWMIISLTKWGSEQADKMWQEFAQNSDTTGTTGGTNGTGNNITNSVLKSIPLAKENYRSVSDNMFDVLLCQSMWNQYVAGHPGTGSAINPTEKNLTSSEATGEGVTIATADGNTNSTGATGRSVVLVSYKSVDNDTVNIDCGQIGFPKLDPQNNNASTMSEWDIYQQQKDDLNSYYNLASSLAGKVAAAALKADANNPGRGQFDVSDLGGMLDFWSQYTRIADAYAAGRSDSIAQSLHVYNNSMGKSIVQDATQYGWTSASAWLNKLAESNGRVIEAASVIPDVTGPTAVSESSSSAIVKSNPYIGSAWQVAYQFMSDARKLDANSSPLRVNPLMTTPNIAKAGFQEILKPSANPLGTVSSYGRKFMSDGLKMTFASSVTPDEVCAQQDPQTGNCIRWRPGAPLKYGEALEKLKDDYNDATGEWGKLPDGAGFTSADDPHVLSGEFATKLKLGGDLVPAAMLRPAGTMLISFGFMAGYVLPMLPFIRFMLGILGWILLLMEAVLAVPLMALSLLKTDGEGFMTQNFQTGAVMILALVIRPMLMLFGMLMGLMAFNGIVNITNVMFLSAADPSNDLQSMIVYLIVYGILVYTLANSAFKAIDILPNQVMSWLGARLDQRVDDASVVHQQSAQMVGNLGMVSAFGGGMRFGKGGGGPPTGGNAGG